MSRTQTTAAPSGSKTRFQRVNGAVERFFLSPGSPLPLACLRISLAILLLIQVYLLRDSVVPLFSRQGWIQGPLADLLRHPGVPIVSWISDAFSGFGLTEIRCLYGVASLYVLSLALFGLGLYTRAAAIAVWFFHWLLMNTAYSSSYGVDMYAHVFLFYMMFAPSGDALSLDTAFRGQSQWGALTWDARLVLRVMQLHLCISYFSSAVEKSFGEQWWNGELIWRSLTVPLFAQFDMTWMAHWPLLLKLGGWSTLVLEGLYFIFIWPKATRYIWIAGIFGLHFGISLFLGLHLFGAIMCLLTLSIFGVPADPVRVVVPLKERGLSPDSRVARAARIEERPSSPAMTASAAEPLFSCEMD